MNTSIVLRQLKITLSETVLPWVLAALRQDACIWEGLLSPACDLRALAERASGPEDWSPARIAWLMLGEPSPDLQATLPPDLHLKATQTYDQFIHNEAGRQVPDLVHSLLLALSLRERYRATGTWDRLGDDLQHAPYEMWRTPLACLYGLLEDPLALLHALLASGDPSERRKLVFHTLLSNPLSPEIQTEQLHSILTSAALSPYQRLCLLQELANLRPELATRLVQRSDSSLVNETPPTSQPGKTTADREACLVRLEHSLRQAEIARLSGDLSQTIPYLTAVQDVSRLIQADSTASLARANGSPLATWRHAVELAPEVPEYRAGLAQALLDANCMDEATLVLEGVRETNHPEILLVAAQLAFQANYTSESARLALSALDGFESLPGKTINAPVILSRLAWLLSRVDHPTEAARAVQLALTQQPNDPNLLALLGQIHSADGEFTKAAQAYQLAVLLAPPRTDLHRTLAECLETLGDWDEALPERKYVAILSEATHHDLHALANCAIHAGDACLARQTCQRVLDEDPEDSQAHILMGEALAALGDLPTALVHLNRATLLAPDLPAAWLSLAHILQVSGDQQKSLEILRTAVQAIPEASEIHLALGEAYLLDNAPSLALTALQRAAELNPASPSTCLRLGQTLHQLGHLSQARQILEAAYQKHPNNSELAHANARVYLSLGESQAAVPLLEAVLANNPVDAEPYVDYARAVLNVTPEAEGNKNYLRSPDKNKIPAVLDALQRALEFIPQHPVAQMLQAEALAEAGDFTASMQAYQSVMELPLAKEKNWQARLSRRMGYVALQLGKVDTALANLLEAVQADPEHPCAHQLLAEAYHASGLLEDTFQSAKEALRLAGDDLPFLLWYSEKALLLSQEGLPPETMRTEAAQALSRAYELAPHRVDLLVRLAKVENGLGDADAARKSLRKVLSIEPITPDELRLVAHELLALEDPEGAITCLEKAIATQPPSQAHLLSDLAIAHQRANRPQAALDVLEKAIALAPGDPELYRAKSHLLLEFGQPQTALACLEEALQRMPQDPGIHFSAARILQAEGNLPAALEHAETAIGNGITTFSYPPAQVLAAELARGLLQPNRARGYLKGLPTEPGVLRTSVCGHCLRAELALEAGEEIEAAEALTAAVGAATASQTDYQNARLLALQARLASRRGDLPAALELFQEALQSSENHPHEAQSHASSAFAPQHASQLYGLVDAGIELGLWGSALRYTQEVVRDNPSEPLAHLTLARVLALRAEFQRLCEDTELVHHAPGPAALSDGARKAFEQAIQSSSERLGEVTHPDIQKWHSRGMATFSPNPETLQVLAGMVDRNSEDMAAYIAALRHTQSKLEFPNSKSTPRTPLVALQLALSLADSHPAEALAAAQTVAHALVSRRDIVFAITNATVARLAHQVGDLALARQANQVALAILPDEPRWHATAAIIATGEGDPNLAAKHLEQAIRLEPRYISHHLALGQLYLEAGNHDEAGLQCAVHTFERACRLAPENPEAWLALAHAHQQTGNLEQASIAAARAASLAPQLSASAILRAEIAMQAGDAKTAYEHAQTAAHLQPDSPTAILTLANALQALNRPAEALTVIEKSLPQAAMPLSLSIERINLIRLSRGAQDALEAALALTQTNPDNPAVLATLANAYVATGQDEPAIHAAQRALQTGGALRPDQQADLRILLGRLLRHAGQLDQAIHHLDEATHLAPERVDSYLELGRAHQDRRQQDQALQLYRRAAVVAPRDPRPYYQAGLALKEGKDYIESESMLRRAADLAPHDVSIRRQLAAVVAINLVHNPRHFTQTIEAP